MGEHNYPRRGQWAREAAVVAGWTVVVAFVVLGLVGIAYAVPYYFGDAWPWFVVALAGVLAPVIGAAWLGGRRES